MNTQFARLVAGMAALCIAGNAFALVSSSTASATVDAAAQCPVIGGVHKDASNRNTAAGVMSNGDWWPNQLNLQILHQNSPMSNPMGGSFDYAKEFQTLDLDALKKDIEEVMTTSQDWWPADYGHYGPLFIRMAWHSAGTYRIADGLEGAWTSTPTHWSNGYFDNLFGYEWELTKSPGGAWQWKPKDSSAQGTVPDAHHPSKSHAPMMLTTDLALKLDPIYGPISKRFHEHPEQFGEAFARAWYKLTHRDMGPVARCLGPWVPEPQLWQDHALTWSSVPIRSFGRLRKSTQAMTRRKNSSVTLSRHGTR